MANGRDGAHGTAARIWAALGGAPELAERLEVAGEGGLPSVFAVSDLAAAGVGVAGLAVAELAGDGAARSVRVDRRLASFWFAFSLRPQGWSLPPPWDPVAGDYAARDGWIRLHTNAPAHRRAALEVLGAPAEREAVAKAVADWSAEALEAAVVAAGGCAAEMRSAEAWRAHPQGLAVAAEPLAHMEVLSAASGTWRPSPARPLAGIKVLDLTRVLAGPVATRFLAGFGAEVLRIDPPDWDEPGVIPEVTLGKRCARLDLRDGAGRAAFEHLLQGADVLVHGYRPGALDRLGLDAARRRALAPGVVEVALDAYGWSGPWASRRGFDSLVQMSAGIAHAGMSWKGADRPTPLPVQALDQATGYLMAACAVRGLTRRLRGEGASASRLSLARTAQELRMAPAPEAAFPAETDDDLAPKVELSAWGPARRLRPPLAIDGAELRWDRPAAALGTDAPTWES